MKRTEQIDALLFDAKIILEELEETAFTWECYYNNAVTKLEQLKSIDFFCSTEATRKAVKRAERKKNKCRYICFKIFDKIGIYREMVDAIQKTYDIG